MSRTLLNNLLPSKDIAMDYFNQLKRILVTMFEDIDRPEFLVKDPVSSNDQVRKIVRDHDSIEVHLQCGWGDEFDRIESSVIEFFKLEGVRLYVYRNALDDDDIIRFTFKRL